MNSKTFCRVGLASLVLALACLLWCSPSHAQSTGAPILSFQRVSVGVGADYVLYRPTVLGEVSREFRATLPVSYNLGRYSSLTFKASYGLESERREFSAGIVFHLLARGKRT